MRRAARRLRGDAVVRARPPTRSALRGLWTRSLLAVPGAPPDTTTRVYWLQDDFLFADIRVPADRRPMSDRDGFDDLSDDELRDLARQQGFAGQLAIDRDVCTWFREVDYQPPTGVADAGRVRLDGDRLVEEGVHLPYRETWERVPATEEGPAGVLLAEQDAAGRRYLLTAGDYFLYVRGRATPLPPAPSLSALIAERAPSRDELIRLLDCEISFGRRAHGRMPWEITLSTLPFREGRPLDPERRGGS